MSVPFVGDNRLVPVAELPSSVVYEKLPLNFSLNFLPTPILYFSPSVNELIAPMPFNLTWALACSPDELSQTTKYY